MNSTFSDSAQGFLKRRSVPHSVERRLKSGVTPASSSSQFSTGVTSTATSGPKPDPPPLIFQPAAPPSSITAAGSFSLDCANAFLEQKNNAANNTNFVALIAFVLCILQIVTTFSVRHLLAGHFVA